MKGSARKETTINEEIGGRLKQFRKRNKISTDEMASAFGIVKDSLSRIEKGTTGLSGEYAYILATKYRCDMNYLFGGIASDGEFYKIDLNVRRHDSQRLSEALHRIADLVFIRERTMQDENDN